MELFAGAQCIIKINLCKPKKWHRRRKGKRIKGKLITTSISNKSIKRVHKCLANLSNFGMSLSAKSVLKFFALSSFSGCKGVCVCSVLFYIFFRLLFVVFFPYFCLCFCCWFGCLIAWSPLSHTHQTKVNRHLYEYDQKSSSAHIHRAASMISNIITWLWKKTRA